MNLAKASQRDRKRSKRRYGPKMDGRNIFTIQEIERKKAEAIRKAREEKEKLVELGLDKQP